MSILNFPPLSSATEEGLLGFGGDLDLETLVMAYSKGIFPWPIKDLPVAWFSPNPRGVALYNKIHISKSLKKFLKRNPYKITINQNFKDVIDSCSQVKRKGQDDANSTWITQEIISAYITLFQNKLAYSVEVWDKNDLVGGLYGVYINGNISAESMFHKKSNASKIAFLAICNILHKSGIDLLDLQVLTDTTISFGGTSIDRDTFISHINEQKENKNLTFENVFNEQACLDEYLKSSK